jgi:hypothetical protein
MRYLPLGCLLMRHWPIKVPAYEVLNYEVRTYKVPV